ncbi:hypothetical protein ACH5RR_014907 [Cinchona calisaya]|uniref:Cysteine-rich receptor-like protein kinase n=1 Tax=Cinchona calisaya TaxID=153742 RepID=A0ABD2ZS19_9GENT
MIPRDKLFLCCLLFLFNFDMRLSNTDYLGVYCVNTTYDPNSTTGSIYKTSLNSTLSFLPSFASQETMHGFYNFFIARVFNGQFLCRGDVNTDVCARCVANASLEILQKCPDQKTATIWLDDCLLRYSNESMFFRTDQNIILSMWNTQNASDPDRFNQLLGDMMDTIAIQAAIGNSGKRFAVEEANYSPFQKIYALGQCTPDVASDDCESCLRNAISNLPARCNNRRGGRVLFPSCNIRYEVYKFYNSVTPEPAPATIPPPPRPPPPTSASTKDKSQLSLQVTIGIVISTILSLMLLVTIFVFLKRRSRRAYDANMQETIDQAGILNIDPDSLKYSLSEIQIATNYFSVNNKIGEGGFGPVYKGTLPNGQDIAVKRLSTRSGQGVEEFKNEIVVVAKLRHNNLVRLLGFCLHGVEKTLIYEFVPNKSLDYFLFVVIWLLNTRGAASSP